MTEIKKCPFCGNKTEIVSVTSTPRFADQYTVHCLKCLAKGPTYFDAENNSKTANDSCIELWNKRINSDD